MFSSPTLLLIGSVTIVSSCQYASDISTIRADLLSAFVNGRDETDTTLQDFVAGSLRLVFHDAGSFQLSDNSGGVNGCVNLADPENAGIPRIIELLEPLATKFSTSGCNQADFWALAGATAVDVALKNAGAPERLVSNFKWGRPTVANCPEEIGRLPSHQLGLDHIRDVFTTRMGFNDREIVTLMGAHTIGRTHKRFSGFDFPWDNTMMKFDNQYYKEVVEVGDWARAHTKETSDQRMWVHVFHTNPLTGANNLMLNTDMALAWDFGTNNKDTEITVASSCQIDWPAQFRDSLDTSQDWTVIAPEDWTAIAPDNNGIFSGMCPSLGDNHPTRSVVQEYADNQAQFHKDFNQVYHKLTTLGVPNTCQPCAANVPKHECCCNGRCAGATPAPVLENGDVIKCSPKTDTTQDYFVYGENNKRYQIVNDKGRGVSKHAVSRWSNGDDWKNGEWDSKVRFDIDCTTLVDMTEGRPLTVFDWNNADLKANVYAGTSSI